MSVIHSLNWRQVKTLTTASIKSRYRNTFAGVLWVILSPLLMYSAQGYIFKVILKIAHPNYPLFLLTGLMPWIFLTQSTSMSGGLFINNARLFKSFPIHPLASLISILADNLLNFVLTFTIVLMFLTLFGTGMPLANLALMILPLLSLFCGILGLCWFLATLQVFFHDAKFITDFALSVLFFLTPIFYPSQFVPAEFHWVIALNPIAKLLQPLQALSLETIPENFALQVVQSYLVSLSFITASYWFWRRKKNELYFRL